MSQNGTTIAELLQKALYPTPPDSYRTWKCCCAYLLSTSRIFTILLKHLCSFAWYRPFLLQTFCLYRFFKFLSFFHSNCFLSFKFRITENMRLHVTFLSPNGCTTIFASKRISRVKEKTTVRASTAIYAVSLPVENRLERTDGIYKCGEQRHGKNFTRLQNNAERSPLCTVFL